MRKMSETINQSGEKTISGNQFSTAEQFAGSSRAMDCAMEGACGDTITADESSTKEQQMAACTCFSSDGLTPLEEQAHLERLDRQQQFVNATTLQLPWHIDDLPAHVASRVGTRLHSVEGCWRLVTSHDFDKYMAALGVKPFTAQLVLRSEFMVTLYEDVDHCWKILTETCIRARNCKGFRCRNYKMTANKFRLGQARPEQLEDWDPRYVETTAALDSEGGVLTLEQRADKETEFRKDSVLSFEATDEEMTVVMETEGARAVRRFVRYVKPSSRKSSSSNNNNGVPPPPASANAAAGQGRLPFGKKISSPF